jgi:protein-L-isoaspartate(D-aspartate) O-methyltransferase
MHAMMLDLMAPLLGPGTSALDIGSGTGYIVACMAKMGAKAYGVEHLPPLIPRSIEAVKKVVSQDQFLIKLGDGRLGLPEFAPYDVIHVGAAAQPEVVNTLMKQLKPNGVLIIPVEQNYGQSLFTYRFEPDGSIKKKHCCDVRFVPLTNAPS